MSIAEKRKEALEECRRPIERADRMLMNAILGDVLHDKVQLDKQLDEVIAWLEVGIAGIRAVKKGLVK